MSQKCVIFDMDGVICHTNPKVVGVLSTHTKEQLPPCDFYINDYSEINVDKIIELLRE